MPTVRCSWTRRATSTRTVSPTRYWSMRVTSASARTRTSSIARILASSMKAMDAPFE